MSPSSERAIRAPAGFASLDWAYATTNHRAQGRTFDTAHVLANPAMCDREWAYVAASRSRFATTIYADASGFGALDPESHQQPAANGAARAEIVAALAARMRRSRAKGTSLDFAASSAGRSQTPDISSPGPRLARDHWPGTSVAAMRKLAAGLASKFRAHASRARDSHATQQLGR